MAALVKVASFTAKLVNNRPGVYYTLVRHHWNKDFKPGPIPKTEEERRKAAERYNVHPDRYEHYPDDGVGFGDYPKLPLVSGEGKDPYYPWDMPSLKRNFNEPIHVQNEMINETRFDVSHRLRFPLWSMWAAFLGTVAFFAGMMYIFNNPTWMAHPPVSPKQMPGEGRKHYLFPTGAPPVHH